MSQVRVIAHRGASGYLPENSLAAAVLAIGMGADAVECDVVMTRDDRLIVLHDLTLDAVTNVSERFAGRARDDGRYYALDFTLDEIRTLRLRERVDPVTGRRRYPGRYEGSCHAFCIPTLEEKMELIRELSRLQGREIGLLIEMKSPDWHLRQNRDLTSAVLGVLRGEQQVGPSFWTVQSFDAQAMRRMREHGGPECQLFQLLPQGDLCEGADGSDWMTTPDGIRAIASYADGIACPYAGFIARSNTGSPVLSSSAVLARDLGLTLAAYTLRADEPLAEGFQSFEDLVRFLAGEADIEALITDHPDRVLRALKEKPEAS